MQQKRVFLKSEKGQSIVIIAAALIAMLALAGLAIDGGNLFLQRRNTQNAADASALAGTRQLARAICGDGATDAEVAHAVAYFAELNGVQDLGRVGAAYVDYDENILGQVGAGSIPDGATGVAVEIEHSMPTYFIRVIGIDTVDVSGSATGMTGPLIASGGLRPIGIPVELVLDLQDRVKQGFPAPEFSISFGNCDAGQCIVSYTDNPGEQIHHQHRGWLNLAYVWNEKPNRAIVGELPTEDPDTWPRAIDGSGDADVLKEWMEHGYNGPALYTFDYIHAKPGKNSSVIGECPDGENIVVPIFDEVPQYDEIAQAKPPPAAQGGGYYYHIWGFMTFEVNGCNQGGGVIGGKFVNAFTGSGQVGRGDNLGYGQTNACWSHTQVVSLWR